MNKSLSGAMNNIEITGLDVAHRYPRDQDARTATARSITEEYEELSLTQLGVQFAVRSNQEQVTFASTLRRLGIATPDYRLADMGREIEYDYIPGEPLDARLRSGDYSGVVPAMSNLAICHTAGVTIGDRWTKNTIIGDDGTATEIDFDIQLLGPGAVTRSLDLAQTIFHTLHFSQDPEASFRLMKNFLKDSDYRKVISPKILRKLLNSHVEHFEARSVYEGINTEGAVRLSEKMASFIKKKL